MSIVRFNSGGSAVYVYEDAEGGITCCMCGITPTDDGHMGGWFNVQTAGQMIAHLRDHERAGHLVPNFAFDALQGIWT